MEILFFDALRYRVALACGTALLLTLSFAGANADASVANGQFFSALKKASFA